MSKREGEYGPVYLLAWYDDDDHDDAGRGRAVLYLGVPFDSPSILVPHKYLIAAESMPPEVAKWIKDHPHLSELMGVEGITPAPVPAGTVALSPRRGVLWRCGILAAAMSQEGSELGSLARLVRSELTAVGVPPLSRADAVQAIAASQTLKGAE